MTAQSDRRGRVLLTKVLLVLMGLAVLIVAVVALRGSSLSPFRVRRAKIRG
jgi:hypothetical protein